MPDEVKKIQDVLRDLVWEKYNGRGRTAARGKLFGSFR